MTFLFSCAIKTSIIVAIALIITRLLPGRSAAVRHWILSAAVFCAIVTPIAFLLLPAWHVSRVIVSTVPARAPIEQASQIVTGTAANHGQTPDNVPERILPWIWLAGFSLSLLTLVIGSIRLARLSAFSRREVGIAWAAAADEISNRYGLRRPVQLLQSRNSSVLVTWGVFHPKILLPAGCELWPEERIRAVLCHEMSHIRRGDWWIQTTAEFLRAVYWFNPLLWVLCHRVRVESEYACDDAVLAQGISGPEYAAQLLDIVCLLQITDRPWSSALGMAGPSTIERRFAAMLNPRINRRSVSRTIALAIAIAGIGMTLPLAALSTSARVQAAPHKPVSKTPDSVSPAAQSAGLQAPSVQQPSIEVSKTSTAVAVAVARPVQPQISAPVAPAPPQQPSQFRGKKVSLNVDAMSLSDFFKFIGDSSGLNVIVDPSVNDVGPMVFHLTNIPWDELLDEIMKQNRLIGELAGNTLKVRQAPTPASDSVRMDFEIYRNGSMLGAPRITTVVTHGATVSQSAVAGSDMKITATPTRTSEGKIQIEVEIFVGNSGTRDVLVVSSDEQRTISWRSSTGESLEARITATVKK